MITKVLIDRLLKPDYFLRASSQAGPYIGQPVPSSSNEGLFRPVSIGDENDQIGNFVFSNGEATTTGTQLSIVDSKLRVFGDSLLNGATVTLTSGVSNSGEVRTVTSFSSDTGTISWDATQGYVVTTVSGDSYTLVLDYSNRMFNMQLTSGGDTGDAEFKWTHDGSQYFGRENPIAPNWKAGTTICSDFYSWYGGLVGAPTYPYTYMAGMPIVQAPNGDILVIYSRDVSDTLHVDISSNNGLTWTTVNSNIPDALTPFRSAIGAAVLKSGRILATGGQNGIQGPSFLMYSDDNGQTWKKRAAYSATDTPDTHKFIELDNGNLLSIVKNGTVADINMRLSTDGGIYWSDVITARSSVSEINGTDLVKMDNGDILCVYFSKEIDPGTTYAVRSIVSTDNGSTWGGVTTIATGNNNLILPCVTKDINGDVYCAFVEQFSGAGSSIVFMVSSDNGVSWGTSRLLASNGNHSLQYPFLNSINGHELVCSYIDDIVGTTSAVFCRSGRAFDISGASNIPCAPNLIKQRFTNNVAVQWYGGDGENNDSWSFTPKHHHASENIVANIPGKAWRSVLDNVTCELIIDMGANSVFYADSIALFDCNINYCSIEMHTADSWASPSSSTMIDFGVASGILTSVNNQYLNDSIIVPLFFNEHELGDGKSYIRMTSGTSSGTAYKLFDNVGNYYVLDTTSSHAISSPDTYNIYKSKIYRVLDTSTVCRYLRIYIPSQKTPDGYYQIGTAIIGKTVTFNNTFADQGYSKNSEYNVDIMKSLSGSMVPVVYSDRKQKWSVTWTNSDTSRKQLQALATHARGKNIAFIPDWFVPAGGSKSATTDVYLVKQVGDIKENFRYKNKWDISVDFEENI